MSARGREAMMSQVRSTATADAGGIEVLAVALLLLLLLAGLF